MSRPPFSRRLYHWINDRIPLARFINWGLHEEIPGGSRFSYALGSACLFLLSIQILSGIWELFYYVPDVDHAYSSLNYLRLEVPFGWLIHGLHYWGASAFTVVVGLHMMRVFIWGAYKKPRELTWLAGVVLLILTAAFMFTGPVLPWDKQGYWAGQVGLGMAGNVPFLGPFLQAVLQGANKMGQLALMRLYVFHVALIPFTIALFVVIHLLALRKFGSTGPWDPKQRLKKVGNFWPEQLFKDAVVAFVLFILLVGLTVYMPPPISGAADPMDTLYTPKPEWNFLFLYQALKYFSGPWEPLGTVGLPTLIILGLVSLPFVDKSPERDPSKRLFVMFCGALFILIVITMTLVGLWSNPSALEKQAQNKAEAAASEQPEVETKSEHPNVTNVPSSAEQARRPAGPVTGEELYKTLGCTGCHSLTGHATGTLGPDLLTVLNPSITRQWLKEQLVDPQKHNPHTIMPPYANLNDQKLNALLDYLQKLETQKPPQEQQKVQAHVKEAAATAGHGSQQGEQIFNSAGCTQCHTIDGSKTSKAGPDLWNALSRKPQSPDWIKTQIMSPQQHNPSSIMPSYARLGPQSIHALVDFLEDLSKKKSNAGNQQGQQGAEAASQEEGPFEEQQQPENQTGLGESIHIIGNREHGMVLFEQSCVMCHGPAGRAKGPHFTAPKGVPALNPLRPELVHQDSQEFVKAIDGFLQHGLPNGAGGPNMPAFGDTHALTQPQIADIEAYVLYLNGVDRGKIIHPGIEPKEFFYMLIEISGMVVLLCILYAWMLRIRM